MRILVMLNPTNKKGTKTAYTASRKFLASDGYVLWGPEIYMRVVTNRKSADTTRYSTDERYGESCFVADGKKIEAFMIHKLVFPEKSHALVIEYALKGDGFFSEDGELYPIEDYPDREQMLKDMISEIES